MNLPEIERARDALKAAVARLDEAPHATLWGSIDKLCDMALQSIESVRSEALEEGWLVESVASGTGGPSWLGQDRNSVRWWTRDANRAIRFSRKQDAEWAIQFGNLPLAKATEHIWLEEIRMDKDSWHNPDDLAEITKLREALQSPARVAEDDAVSLDLLSEIKKRLTGTPFPESPAKEQPGEQFAAPQAQVAETGDSSVRAKLPAVAAPDMAWIPVSRNDPTRQVAWVDQQTRHIKMVTSDGVLMLHLPPPPERP